MFSMIRSLPLLLWLLALLPATAPAADYAARVNVTGGEAPEPAAPPAREGAKVRVLVIPVRDQITDPVLYIIRRGLKSASKDDLVILDMKTPGGALGTALEIMEALDKFEGHTATYVNDEAVSAGAFIASVTQDIYFAPNGVIGAAAAVTGEGGDIPETMRLKINSYLKAKVRAYSAGRGNRAQVISAMLDKDFEFRIGDTVVKPKGELLSLTASEAAKTYGEPPRPLLSAGTAKSLEELLDRRLGAGNYTIERLEVTWSEHAAQHLTNWSPILLGLGLLLIFIEFKVPGFGGFGLAGGALLLLVFFGSHVAGLSGHEPVLVFVFGLALVIVEVLLFPGVVVVALSGLVCMLGALVWAMADLWPDQPLTFSGDTFVRPLTNLGWGFLVAIGLGLLLARFIPKGWFFQRLAVAGADGGSAQIAGGDPADGAETATLVGVRGTVVTGLFPGGQIEIAGRRYEARVEVGSAPVGATVVVRRASDFSLIVEVVEK